MQKLRIFNNEPTTLQKIGIEKRETVKRFMICLYPEECSGAALPENAANQFGLWHGTSPTSSGLIPRWVYELAEEVILKEMRPDLKPLAKEFMVWPDNIPDQEK